MFFFGGFPYVKRTQSLNMSTFKFFLRLLLIILSVATYDVAHAATPNIGCELNQEQKYCQHLSQANANSGIAILLSMVPILEKLTEDKFKKLISKKRQQFDLLKETETANNLTTRD